MTETHAQDTPQAPVLPGPDVYRERAHLVAFLTALYPSHAGFSDPAAPEWMVVTVETPRGQMSWHVAAADQGLFNHVRRTGPTDAPWDGHSTPEKYERLARLRRDVWHAAIASGVQRETFGRADRQDP